MDWVLLTLGLIVGIELIMCAFFGWVWYLGKLDDDRIYRENIKPDNHRYINLLKG